MLFNQSSVLDRAIEIFSAQYPDATSKEQESFQELLQQLLPVWDRVFTDENDTIENMATWAYNQTVKWVGAMQNMQQTLLDIQSKLALGQGLINSPEGLTVNQLDKIQRVSDLVERQTGNLGAQDIQGYHEVLAILEPELAKKIRQIGQGVGELNTALLKYSKFSTWRVDVETHALYLLEGTQKSEIESCFTARFGASKIAELSGTVGSKVLGQQIAKHIVQPSAANYDDIDMGMRTPPTSPMLGKRTDSGHKKAAQPNIAQVVMNK